MNVLRPTSLDDALALRAAHPGAVPLAGGTDLMVEINFDRARPATIIDLTRVPELERWERADGTVRVGAGVTYARVIAELRADLPGLAAASRTVGSPQIRNRGTIGGNIATASPAGDALPPLVAAGAVVELASVRGSRDVSVHDLFVGPKRTTIAADELVVAVRIGRARGPQQFAKIGTRNAMVIAVTSFALDVDLEARRVGTGIGSAGPTPLGAPEAEAFLQSVLDEHDLWGGRAPLPDGAARSFGDLVGSAARPIDDVRATAAYRRHALSVLARRTLTWAWSR